MEYVYAALLLHKLKKPITEDGIKKVLVSAGANVNEARIKALVATLSEIDIDEAIKSATVTPTVSPATPAPEEKKEEEKKEEKEKKEKEKEEEEALAGLSALFG